MLEFPQWSLPSFKEACESTPRTLRGKCRILQLDGLLRVELGGGVANACRW